MNSKLEEILTNDILKAFKDGYYEIVREILYDEEIKILQSYANQVSIIRLNYNDHGPVHMRKVVLNALKMLEILYKTKIPLNIESEKMGTYKDIKLILFLAGFLHDIGMTIGRENHDYNGVILVKPIIEKYLSIIYKNDLKKQYEFRSLIIESILGHMGNHHITTVEAGIILIADGLDMEKGRARIPSILDTKPTVGDIHQYSSSAIKKVYIEKGIEKPIKIIIDMESTVGFFQVEEVLMKKISSSTIKEYIELHAGVIGEKHRKYL